MGKHKELSTDDRNKVVQFLLQSCKNGKPARGAFNEAATKFCINRCTASRYWKAARTQMQSNVVINSVSGKKTRPKRILKPLDYAKFKVIPKSERSSQLKIYVRMGVSKTTVQRWYKMHLLVAHTSALHPQLTQDNKFLRVRFSLEALELDRILNSIRFSSMQNIVHIDEKWFYITKGSHRYYLAPDEEVPHRTCQNKKFIGKIMFVCAVSRPLLAGNGEVLFDGKIGIWPLMESCVAKRKSRLRAKGTRYNKPLDSINREVMKQTLIEKIIPAIRQKWPSAASKDIRIQQDNAKPHVKGDDLDFLTAAREGGFNMKLVQQPPNSPDTNVLDLGFFNAIQSLQYESACNTLEELVNVVIQAFYNISPTTLNKVFLSLQVVMIEILKAKGHNNFKLPHMGKDALIRAGELPTHLEVSKEVVTQALTFLLEAGQINGIIEMGHRLGVEATFGILDLFGSLQL